MPDLPPTPATGEREATEPVNPAVRYERQDADVRSIVIAAAVIAAVAVAVPLVGLPIFQNMQPRRPAPGSGTSVLSQDRLRLPRDLKKVPQPRLQINEVQDMTELRAHEKALLDTYGWVDARHEVVRIPIARALEILADPKMAAAHGVRSQPAKKRETPAGEGR
jgi:hypothetical protein